MLSGVAPVLSSGPFALGKQASYGRRLEHAAAATPVGLTSSNQVGRSEAKKLEASGAR